jgi:SAM-dependent methyltransferase
MRSFLVRGSVNILKGCFERLKAAYESFRFQDEGLPDQQFIRFCLYRDIKRMVARAALKDPDVLEIGSSNGVIASYLNAKTSRVTGDYPALDVCAMPEIGDERYDVVILDQVLEHVQAPAQAIAEVRRVLRPGGYAIIAVPFLIRIHGAPSDYWRFTADGLRHLLKDFRDVEIGQWGNRFTLRVVMRHGWLSVRQTRRRLMVYQDNEPAWPLTLWAICKKESLAA